MENHKQCKKNVSHMYLPMIGTSVAYAHEFHVDLLNASILIDIENLT